MNSLGSSSKWPSYKPLASTLTYVLSESDHTEDEADVFSEGEGEGVRAKSYLGFPPRSHQPRSWSWRDPDADLHSDPASPPAAAAALGSSSATPGDLAFAQKCADLHRFTRPLLDLLRGLKKGRFDKGLTSFQQSVAIDRLQRIIGILQNPDMGERYLQNLTQIEMMLKIWFPRLAFPSIVAPSQTVTHRFTPHWNQNQMHMPVKKRKLSWSDPDIPAKLKHLDDGDQRSYRTSTPHDDITARLQESVEADGLSSSSSSSSHSSSSSSSAGHTFTQSSSTLSRHRKQPSHCAAAATQVRSVSSTGTVIITSDSH